FDERMLDLFRWVADRYLASLATVITRSYPPRVAGEEEGRPSAGTVRSSGSTTAGQVEGMDAPPLLRGYRHGADLLAAIAEHRGGTYRLRPVPEQEQQTVVEAVDACLAA